VAVVWIPSLLQSLTDGADTVVVSGTTVGEIIDHLEARFPGVKDRLVQGGEIRPHIAVAIDGDVSPEGLEQDVQESSEIHFIPALGGGIDDVPAHAPAQLSPPWPSTYSPQLTSYLLGCACPSLLG
jgi:molybdopterin synthase sulfur carrier subunit